MQALVVPDEERGKIKNRQYANRVRDFSGLRYGNITATDIDGLIEYKNTCYIFIETKYKDAELPFGQRLALERITDDLEKVKPVITIVATYSNEGDIDVARALVCEYRFRGAWHKRENTTTRELIDKFLSWVEWR